MTASFDTAAPQASPPTLTMLDYLELVRGGVPGFLTFWTKRTKAHLHFAADELSIAAEVVSQLSAGGDDVYVRANVQAERGGTTAETVAAMTVLTLDFDMAGPGHKTSQALPTTPDDLNLVLNKADVPLPTMRLSTGGGLLAVWALETPLFIRDLADRERAKELSIRFQGRIRQVAKSLGLHVDSTADIVRAIRIPGTRNWKPAYGPNGAEVTVLS